MSQKDFVPALRAPENIGAPLTGQAPQQDALAKDCEAALTSVLLGFAGALQASALDTQRMLDGQCELPRRHFYRLVHLLTGQGSLQLSNFFVRLGKLTNQVRLGHLTVDDGLLRADYLIDELCTDLAKFRPIAGIDGRFEDADQGRDGAKRCADLAGHGGHHAE